MSTLLLQLIVVSEILLDSLQLGLSVIRLDCLENGGSGQRHT